MSMRVLVWSLSELPAAVKAPAFREGGGGYVAQGPSGQLSEKAHREPQ